MPHSLDRLLQTVRTGAQQAAKPQRGQALVQMTLILVTFFSIVGGGIDWGRLTIEDARIQHAADAAALAGARSLITGTSPGSAAAGTAATASATSYLTLHGYTHGVAGTIVDIQTSSSAGNGFLDTITVQVNRTLDAFFWKLMGIQTLPVQGRAVARPGAATVDVMLSLDLTGSMQASGTNDLDQLRAAVAGFLNQINPDSANVLGPKVGIARWAGIYCSWRRVGNGDLKVDLWGTSEYEAPCYDDKTILSTLTYDKATLLKIANNSGAAACPAGAVTFGCPLSAVQRYPSQINGTPANPTNYDCWNGWWSCGSLPAHTGTKMPNAITVMNPGSTGAYAWHTNNGGRNGSGGLPNARKVMVMMTDGVNESPSNPEGQTATQWATDVVTLANTLKLGPDATAGTADDVEIYVIGFFCTPYSTSTTLTPDKWCKSQMANTALPHPCPSTTWNAAAASTTDTLLKNVSSSTAGGCERYYPIKKTESLPDLFLNIAGSIQRGRLST